MEYAIIFVLSALLCAINWGYARILCQRKRRFYAYMDLVTLWMKIGTLMFDILFFAAMFFRNFPMYLHPLVWLGIKTIFISVWALVAVNWFISYHSLTKRNKN